MSADVVLDEPLLVDLRGRVQRAAAHLGWPEPPRLVVRRHCGGASQAVSAPYDQLFVATELNEWALCACLAARDPARWAHLERALLAEALEASPEPAAVIAPVLEEQAALARLSRLSRAEARPALMQLLHSARALALPFLLDDTSLTLGTGATGRTFSLGELPASSAVPWSELGACPTALVTGSNGKTTTVRLIAACAQTHGLRPGLSCTDGVYVGESAVAVGDYSGPDGTRLVLRDPRVEVAVLETARGGILRRGLAVERADVAVVTNVSVDHFGEYGIYDVDGLADTKLAVASVLGPGGVLVLGADDEVLRRKAAEVVQRCPARPALAWFALDADHPTLSAHRARGGSTSGVRDGRLLLTYAGVDHDLGRVTDLPLTVGGSAEYNVANLAGAALGAAALGIPPLVLAQVFARFGAGASDNPGRMMCFERGGARILVDYAHNPEGLRGLFKVAAHLRRGQGRLGLLLGHAGNRREEDIVELAHVAAEAQPDFIVVKEIEDFLRGRAPGEIPQLIYSTLLARGMPREAMRVCPTELEAARSGLAWVRPGDVLLLLVHSRRARAEVLSMLASPPPER